MLKIEIVPTLSECIETRAKSEFDEAVARLVAGGRDEEMELKVETLRLFLEKADFRKLRAESERHLLEGRRAVFLIYLQGRDPQCDLMVE